MGQRALELQPDQQAREGPRISTPISTQQAPDSYPAVEAYLEEVLTFEHALITATLFGSSSDVRFTADQPPTPPRSFEALDHGSLPNNLTPTRSSLRVTAAPGIS